jgi:hypothetical protein
MVPLWSEAMADEKSKRGVSQDRARVAGGQKHEVAYEAGKKDVSPADVRDAVRKAGPSRDKVEQQIDSKK